MLILYNKDEKNFLSNGIGVLDKHAFDDVVTEELNGIFKLEFSYPIFAKYSAEIVADNIVRATTPDSEQPFFVSRIVKKDGFLRVTAYHIFYKLIWELIEDINIVNQNGQAALDRILTGTGFTGLSDITKTASIRIVRYNVVEAIVNKGKDNTFISRFGGEIKRDKFRVEVINHVGRYYDQFPNEIRYAKNLVSYEADIDSNNAATRIMPLAFNGLLLPEKYVAKPGADPNNFKTVKVEYPDIKAIQDAQNPKEDEIPLEEAYEKMRQAVLSDFTDGRFDAKASYRVEFQDLATTEEYKNKAVLETLLLGDEVKVIHTDENLNILSRVISYRWSPLRKEYDEIELGNHQENFSSLKPVLESIAVKVEQYKTDWEKNIDEITLILNSALGGYVYKRAGELLIMDTDDPDTALKVWRWNLNGLGYSKVGVNGPYEIAITMDGRIMASFIYVNKLSALSADLGEVTAGKLRSADGTLEIDLANKTIRIGSGAESVHTDLQYNGMQIKDGEKLVAAFGESGAVIPIFEADEFDCPVIAGVINQSATYSVGSGQTYPSVGYVLQTVLKNRKILNNAILTFEINGTLNEMINIKGYSGSGGIILKFMSGAVLNGNITADDNTLRTYILCYSGMGLIKRTSTEPIIVNNCYVDIYSINIDCGPSGGAGILGSNGAFVTCNNVDIANANWCIIMDYSATGRFRNTRGNAVSSGLVAQNGAVIHTWGTSPNANPYEYGGTIHGTLNPTASTFSVPPVTAKTFTAVFSPTSMYTVNHDTASVDGYYGATAAQGKYSGMSYWKDGVMTFGPDIYNYWQGGYNVLVEMRVRRKNSSHGSSAGVVPQAYNFSPSEAFNAIGQGGWSEWTTVPAAVFGAGGATLKFYNGNLNSGYAIFDAAEVKVTVTKNV